jgi:hypothetical protein
MWLWGITASLSYHRPGSADKITKLDRFLSSKAPLRRIGRLRRTLPPRDPPRKQPWVLFGRGARRECPAGHSPPVCCSISW